MVKFVSEKIAQDLRWIVTFYIGLIMLFCLIFRAELFPFAPYMMYSGVYRPNEMVVYRIFVSKTGNDPIEILPNNQSLVSPFDETRLKQSISNSYSNSRSGLNNDEIRTKARSILAIVNKNSDEDFDHVTIGIYTYHNLEALRKKQLKLIEQIDEKMAP